MASLLERIRTAALNYSALAGSPLVTAYPLRDLLGSGSPLIFRWYDSQLIQGSKFPAVSAFVVSNPPTYCFTGRTAQNFGRIQFVIWGGQGAAGAASAQSVADAMYPFFDQLALYGVTGLVQYSNIIMLDREAVFPQTDTLIYQRIMDVKIFSADTITPVVPIGYPDVDAVPNVDILTNFDTLT